jgi:hypothetical protein
MSATTMSQTTMGLAGQYLASLMDRKIMDHTALSCNGRDVASREHHYKISQIVKTITSDFRWKVAVFSRERCEVVQTFSSQEKATVWIDDVSRNHTWVPIEAIGL